jgi:predicted GIY-YIG superfamily endonuclease
VKNIIVLLDRKIDSFIIYNINYKLIMSDKTTIYVLKLKNNKYYVGKTNNVQKRFMEHMSGNGSAWTKKYKPIEIIETIKNASKYDEDKYVKKYMDKYGMNNVRGGTYVNIELSDDMKQSISRELASANDLCTRCSRQGHFIKDCYAKTDINGCIIDDISDDSSDDSLEYSSDDSSDDDTCYRCGREGHFSNNCYASTHVKGYKLY